ncbi:Midasin [Araneus ventricosus]|uniref:Midasin n=1 Tax=Araneus ventricosus TaxID=182803 RepID=A0A4Y2SUS2_ARAVE|nr:Midasin [Araneus ventricosus]
MYAYLSGFCIPADLQEEAQKSGDTKFEDIESGGLDEGEGVKDVSENIETEDQLEDTLKEGEEKKEKEESEEIKDEEKGIEMSEDFEGKSYNPEKTADESETSDNEEESEDLDKQMGDVDGEDSEKLDEKVWGSDSEDEDQEINDANDTGGVSENKPSELVAKDALEKENDRDKSKLPEESLPEENKDEYQGNAPDPLIDAPPDQEPEVVELPDDMEITDDVDKEDGEIEPAETEEITYDPDEELESKEESEEVNEPEEANEDDPQKNPNTIEEDKEEEMDVQNGTSAEPVPDENEIDDEKNESKLPTHTPTTEKEALPSADQAKSSSHDPVQEDAPMDWESGTQQSDEQTEEGQADARNEKSAAHEGARSSSKQSTSEEQQQKPKLKPPAENRTLDENTDNSIPKQRPIADKQSLQKSLGAEDDADDNADVYEHVSNKEDGVTEAVDVATEEQAAKRPAQTQNDAASDSEEIIELSSDEEEEYCDRSDSNRTQGDIIKNDTRRRPGELGNYDEEESMDTTPEGEIVRTHTVPRGDTTIHTQYDLWSSMSLKNIQERRHAMEKNLELFSQIDGSAEAVHIWKNYEDLMLNLAQELCEQLRLVLEPTKMSKLKGDYRTGKRLNMRKIIPYIASQFRKDKIWLRRTKPSKRQYQIMLAVDDSSSMADNHSKQLAFESLAVLGQSLSLLEAGELSVVSFGEKVELLLGFNEQFSTNTGARMLQHLTFRQEKTNYVQLLKYATDVMVQSRNRSALMSKETAQLLVILSDGRGIFNDDDKGKGTIVNAVREARDNNVFMVFIIIDSPDSQASILDIQRVTFDNKKVTRKQYLEDFPFPFYIILRDISVLPTVLGGALRQWFELVTATER